jgi:uncharacterized protein YkwD
VWVIFFFIPPVESAEPPTVGLVPAVHFKPKPSEELVEGQAPRLKLGDVYASDLEVEVFNEVNQARTNPAAFGYGNLSPVPPLEWNAALLYVAWLHSVDMAADNYFNHDSYDRSGENLILVRSWSDRIREWYSFNTPIAENIAWNTSGSAHEIVQAWMDSQGHRENIMNISNAYTEGAIGIATGNGKVYWTHDFGGRAISHNLTVDDLAFDPPSPQPGDTVNVSFHVSEMGETDAFPVEVSIYRGNPASGGVPIVTAYQMGPIVQAHLSYALAGDVDTTGFPADSEIYIWVDPNNRFPEGSETDNLAYRKLFTGTAFSMCDLNRDTAVNSLDVFRFSMGWQQSDSAANLDGTGLVNSKDMVLILSHWPADH